MAHRGRQRDASEPSLGEIDSLLSDPLVLPPEPVDALTSTGFSYDLTAQDLRQWTPEAYTARLLSGALAPLDRGVIAPPNMVREFMEFPERMKQHVRSAYSPIVDRFKYPSHVVECVRRKVRREVMFSKSKRARSKGAGARRRRNDLSNVRC